MIGPVSTLGPKGQRTCHSAGSSYEMQVAEADFGPDTRAAVARVSSAWRRRAARRSS
jgi:hypothetical protein